MKRFLTALALSLACAVSFGATLSPVQLLNPAGSTAGQAILSTGPTTAPTWGGFSATSLTGILPVANGGTNAGAASGTTLDNITGFASTGFLTRTGAGTYAFQSTTNGITLANLVQGAANTVLANATGSTANFAAFTMPSCSTSASALNWTTSTGFTCNTAVNAAQLGGATFAAPGPIGSTTASTGAFTTLSASSTVSGTGFSTYLASPPAIGGTAAAAGAFTTLSATGNFTPSQTNGIVGTTTNNNANAGSVGEFVSSSVAAGSAVALTSGTPANVTSISLTAGDWDVWGTVAANPAGSTVVTLMQGGISTTSATMPSIGTGGSSFSLPFSSSAGIGPTGAVAPTRISVSTTTTVYLVANSTFTTSTNAAFGNIQARRRR